MTIDEAIETLKVLRDDPGIHLSVQHHRAINIAMSIMFSL